MTQFLHTLKTYRLICIQIGVVFLLAMVWLITKDLNSGLLTIFGGLAWIIPSLYFLHKIIKALQSKVPSKMFVAFYVSELIKFILSATIIVLFLKFYPTELFKVLPFMSGLIGAVLSSMLMPFLYGLKNE